MLPTPETEAAPGQANSDTAPLGDCEQTSSAKVQSEKATGSGVMSVKNGQNSSGETHAKLQFISLETINVTKDGSNLSRIEDERDEVCTR